MCGFLLLSFARCYVEWGSRWSQGLGEQVHPHHQTPLTHTGSDRSQNRNGHNTTPTQISKKKLRQVVVEPKETLM